MRFHKFLLKIIYYCKNTISKLSVTNMGFISVKIGGASGFEPLTSRTRTVTQENSRPA